MKRYLLFLFTILISLSLSAQCLGDDCSIKGRNKAAKKKAVKMTKSKRAGRTYSSSRKKRKRNKSKGFDPFASRSSKKSSSQGYDPFENYDKKKKKGRGTAYDPFATKSKRKYKGSKGGYDPFAKKKGRKGVASAGGYDPFENGKKHKFRNSTSSYDGWDSKTSSVRHRRGKANDSWASGYNSKNVSYEGNDSWANKKSHKNPSGGTWLAKANPFKSRGGGNNNWDQDNSGFGAPSYERQDNIPRSYDEYESSNFSSDVVFNRPHYYKYSLIYGGVIKHSSKVDAQLAGTDPRPVLGAEFGVEYPTQGEINWHHYFNMPTYGYAFTYLNLGEDDRLGSAIAFYPYLDIPLIRSKAVDFNFSNGVGIAYVTQYDQTTSSNPDPNPATNSDASYLIGSPVNMFIKSGFNLSWRPVTQIRNDDDELNSRYTINAGISWMHLSNGNISSPNTGINMWGANLSLKHTPTAVSDVLRQSNVENLLHILSLDIMGTAGIREFYRLENQKYVVGNFNATVYYQAANIYKIGLGIDGFYDEVFQYNHTSNYYPGESSRYDGLYDPSDLLHSVRGGVCLSNEFVIGRTSAAFDAGYYVYDNIKADEENMYYRFALKYRFTKNFFGAAAVKTHQLTNAEFFTIGAGYSFNLY